MNIFTFDIEEWYLEKVYFGNHKEKYIEFDSILGEVLDKLDEKSIKATFFCVGEMARYFPDVLKKINERNHEIGCHSNKHNWLTLLSRREVIEDTKHAIESLEHCCGKKVLSYRAPAFSIVENNKWIFEILAEFGITRDASIFPALRDFGGFQSFNQKTPTIINSNKYIIKEFPISTFNIFGNEIAYSGGGYFRFFPLKFIKNLIKKNSYSMIYIHIGDLLHEKKKLLTRKEFEDYFKEKGTIMNRYKRYFKNNFGKKIAFLKLIELLESTEFINLEQADDVIDWSSVPRIEF